MRFGLVHRVMTDALATLGVLALVASGQFSRELDFLVMLALALAIAMKEPWRQVAAQKHLDAIATFLLVATQVGRAVLTPASVLDLLIEFAVGLQVIRVATRNGAAHDQQVIVLALLHLIAGTVVGGGLGYGLCFFGLLVVTPGALVLSHLRREVEGNYRQGARDRTGLPVDVPRILRSKRVVGKQFIAVTCLLSVPILLFTVALFVVFPRVGLSLLLLSRPRSGRMIGFSGKVDLGQIGTLRSDPTIALRVHIPDLPASPPQRRVMHLRGTALDHYDGRTWTQSQKMTRTIAQAGEMVSFAGVPAQGERGWRIELEPFEPPVLFLAPHAKAIELAKGSTISPGGSLSMVHGPEGELRYQAPSDRVIRYEMFVIKSGDSVTYPRLRASDRSRYLQLPEDMPERIGKLAAEWTKDVDGESRRADIIESRLRSEFRYDLSSPSGKSAQPLDHFLFESKRGHCEYFSTAMAVMLRTLGIPSRNVTGFIGGTYNKFGNFYAVRQGDAHSWIEAHVDGRWVTFDPTPPGAAAPQGEIDGVLASMRDFFEAISQRWNQHVLGYDLRQQVSLFESLSSKDGKPFRMMQKPRWRIALALLGVLIAGVCGYLLYRRRKRAHNPVLDPERPQTKDAVLAAALYRALDRAMSAAGVGRQIAMPPLRHALNLQSAGHPLSSEVLALTERYLDARYGDRAFTSKEQREFEQRVRWLKQAPHAPRPVPGALPPRKRVSSMRGLAARAALEEVLSALPAEPPPAVARPSRRPPPPDNAPIAAVEAEDRDRAAVVATIEEFPESVAEPDWAALAAPPLPKIAVEQDNDEDEQPEDEPSPPPKPDGD
jgi:hypothetical protein